MEQNKMLDPQAVAAPVDENAEMALEREFARDAVLEEYETDRDAILLFIKDAIRERRYQDAQEFVFKYRAAAKTDENFKILARLTAQGLDTEQRIAKVETVLDATPDSDYDTRMALYEQILRIDPGHEKYKAALEQCRQQKAGITIQPSDAASSAVSAQEGMGKYVKSIGIAIGVILLLVWLVQTFF